MSTTNNFFKLKYLINLVKNVFEFIFVHNNHQLTVKYLVHKSV